MALQDMLDTVSQCTLFTGLTHREQYNMLRYFQPRQFKSGHTFIKEGQLVDELYMTGAGKWEVFLPKNVDGEAYRPEEVHLQTVTASAMLFGEFSFFDRRPASASVRALEDCEIYTVSYDDFMKIVDSDDHAGKIIYKNMLNVLINKLRKDNDEKDWLALMVD